MFFLKRIFVTPTKYIFFMFINYSKYSLLNTCPELTMSRTIILIIGP